MELKHEEGGAQGQEVEILPSTARFGSINGVSAKELAEAAKARRDRIPELRSTTDMDTTLCFLMRCSELATGDNYLQAFVAAQVQATARNVRSAFVTGRLVDEASWRARLRKFLVDTYGQQLGSKLRRSWMEMAQGELETLAEYYDRCWETWQAHEYCAGVCSEDVRESEFAAYWTQGLEPTARAAVEILVGDNRADLGACYEAARRPRSRSTSPSKRKQPENDARRFQNRLATRLARDPTRSVLAAVHLTDDEETKEATAPAAAPAPEEPVQPDVLAVLAEIQGQLNDLRASRAPTTEASNSAPEAARRVRFASPPRGDRRGERSFRPNGPVKCYHCEGPHYIRDCPTYKGCDLCGGKGHRKSHCYKNPDRPKSDSRSSGRSRRR